MTFNYDFVLSQMELFLLILVRITAFAHTAPFFSISNVPIRVKLGLSIFISLLVFSVNPNQSYAYDGIIGYALLIGKEALVGVIIGYSANICMQVIHFAGHIIDVNIGMAMATMYDPATKMQVNISGNLYYYLVMMLMLISGLHQFIVRAIVDTYTVLPVGAATINPGLYSSVLGFIADYFVVGFRIALPVFITIMIVNSILGIMARVAPQMNMFAVGIGIKVVAGLVIMYVTVALLPLVASVLMENMKEVIVKIVEGLY